jgi:hypothetical protein
VDRKSAIQQSGGLRSGLCYLFSGSLWAFSFKLSCLALAIVFAASAAQAQQNAPRIGYTYPAGGRQGTSFQVVVGGQYLNSATNALVSGTGVLAKIIAYTRPLTAKEANDLREKLKSLQEKRMAAQNNRRGALQAEAPTSTNVTWTSEDQRMALEIRTKLASFGPNRQQNPAIAENVILQITIAPDANPDDRELRLQTLTGLSNPLLFRVGQLPEFSQRAAGREPVNLNDAKPGRDKSTSAAPPSEMNITLPCVVNGQIMPGGVNWFRFKAQKGQHLVVAAAARELIPYLPDAVPGWFQASLALYDAKGKELEYADHFRFSPDPVLYYEIPKDGEYFVTIRDSIYRGREDFVYRVTLGELPFVTSIFPLGGPAGAQTRIDLKGWNLPVTNLTMDAGDKAPGIYPLSKREGEWLSNPALFAVTTLPECLEQEPNNEPGAAQSVAVPIIINGRIDPPGDIDVFRFEGRAGSQIVAEIYARRLNSPLDSVLKLTDSGGRQLAFNDDHEDKGSGLNTHHADSYLTATLPADGTYYLRLWDAQHQGGPEYAYRLRISAPRPDFELRVVPSSVSVRPGASVPLTVYALRKDGFSNQISIVLKDAPAGFSLSGGEVPSNTNRVRVTLTAPQTSREEPFSLNLAGRAIIDGDAVTRPAVPAEDMMQAYYYRHLVPSKQLLVAVSGRWMPRAIVKILGETPVKIPAGGTARVRIATPRGSLPNQLQLELSEPPDGIVLQSVVSSGESTEIVLRTDAGKVAPGQKGNLIVQVMAERPSTPGKAKTKGQRMNLSALPAIPFEIIKQ